MYSNHEFFTNLVESSSSKMISGKKKIKTFSSMGRLFELQFNSLSGSPKAIDQEYFRPETPENFSPSKKRLPRVEGSMAFLAQSRQSRQESLDPKIPVPFVNDTGLNH